MREGFSEPTVESRLSHHTWSEFVDQSRGFLRRNLGSLAALVVGSFVFVAISSNVRQGMRVSASERFDAIATVVAQGTRDQLNAYTGILIGVRGLFHANDDVTGNQFRGYVDSLGLKESFPGFEVLNYAAYVKHEDKQAFEQRARLDEALKKRSPRPFEIHPPGDRPEYFPIVYIEPSTTGARQIGFDIGLAPEAMEAVQRSRATGELLSTGRVRVVSGLAFISLRLPIYENSMPIKTAEERRAAYIGSVGAAISLEGLFRPVLAGREVIRLRIYDGGPTPLPVEPEGAKVVLSPPHANGMPIPGPAPNELNNSDLIWDSAANIPSRPSTEKVLRFEFASRVWLVRVSADERSLIPPLERRLPDLIVVTGVLLIALLLVMQRLLSRRHD